MADDAMQAELDQSRVSSMRLLEGLATKIGATRAVQSAKGGVHRAAQYVQEHSMRDMAGGLEETVRRRPTYSMAIAVIAGYLLGRAVRPLRRESMHHE